MRYHFEQNVLDTERRELRRGEMALPVAPQVFDLLEYLIRNRERVVSKDDLIAAIWDGRIVSDAALTTRMNVARTAIGDSGEEQRLIKTLPRRGFRFIGNVLEQEGNAGSSGLGERPPLELPDRPSIAILPFANFSPDPSQDYFADGVVEDITTALSRFSELFVIARNSSLQYKGRAVDVRQVGRELGVRYVLEGSIRKAGPRLRITVQLIDAVTTAHVWAENFDRAIEDMVAIQDELVGAIAAILTAQVRKAEAVRARGRPPANWQSHDHYYLAVEAVAAALATFDVGYVDEARKHVERALALDPLSARAYVLLSKTYAMVWINNLNQDHLGPAALDKAELHARKAVELDPNLPEAHAMLGYVLIWRRKIDPAIAAFERSIALNPNYSDWRFGWALLLAGEPQRAIDALKAYMRLDPFHGPMPWFFVGVGHFMLKDYQEAVVVLTDYVSHAPTPSQYGYACLAAAHAQLDQPDKAQAAVVEAMRMNPDFTISGTARRLAMFKSAEDDAHFFGALRKAGLPE